MIGLGVFFWLYLLRPRLPLVRGLGWWYAGIAPEFIARGWFGVIGKHPHHWRVPTALMRFTIRVRPVPKPVKLPITNSYPRLCP